MSRLLLKLCGLALAVMASSLASAQVKDLRSDEKAAIVAALKQFSDQRPLLRPLKLDGNPLPNGVKLTQSQYMGQIGPGTSDFIHVQLSEGRWKVRQLYLSPYRSDLLQKANPALSDEGQAWALAERQFANELKQGLGWERDRATWHSFEGRERVSIRLIFKPAVKDHPVVSDPAGFEVQYRASDAALIDVRMLSPLKAVAGPVKVTQEKAIAVGRKSLLPVSDKLTARLAYMLPPYALSPGIIDRRTGKEMEPALKLMWEVTAPTASAAVNPETGTVEWVATANPYPQDLTSFLADDGDSPSLAEQARAIPWPHQDLILQGLGFLAILMAVGFIINWVMKKDSASRA